MKTVIISTLLLLILKGELFAQQKNTIETPVFNESGTPFSSKEEVLAAYEKAKLAKQEAEKQRIYAIKGPGLNLSQSVALKSQKVEDPELRKLLAKEAYEIHLQTEGSYNDPFIFNALVEAVGLSKEQIVPVFSLDFALEKLLLNHRYDPANRHITSPFFAHTAHGADVEVPWALDIHANKSELAFSVNGYNQGYFEWWDSKTKQLLHKIDAHQGMQVFALAFTPGASGIYSAGANQEICFTGKDGKSKTIVENVTFEITDLAVSGDGGHVAAAGDAAIHIWNTETNKVEFVLANPYSKARSTKLTISPAGRFVAVSYEDGTVLIWDIVKYIEDQNYPPNSFEYPNKQITNLAFSPNGTELIAINMQEEILLWNVLNTRYENYNDVYEFPFKSDDYQPVIVKMGLKQAVSHMIFTEDNQVAIKNLSGESYTFYTSMDTYAEKICQQVCKNLSDAEWLEYIGNDSKKEGEIYLETFRGLRYPTSTCPSCPQRP